MDYDIKIIDKWEAPKEDGAPLLTMPNVPLPLHTRAPRTIMRPSEWNKVRQQVYEDANYTCQISGVDLGKGRCHNHECYDIDWANQTMTFNRYVCVAPRLHTRFIHSGRALSMFKRKDKNFPKSALMTTLEEGFHLIKEWNDAHPDEEPLRVSSTFLDWAKDKQLEVTVDRLIHNYDIKFYDFDHKCFDKEHWANWKLVYNGEEYPTKFASHAEWEEEFNSKGVK